MSEKRRAKRLPVDITLKVETLFKQDNVRLDAVNETIEVTNLSKTGIGFSSRTELPLDFYFNARITIDEEKFFYSVVKIIRKEERDGHWFFGCEFVGLADVLSGCIDDYEKELI